MLKSIRNSLILLFLTIVSFDTEAKTQVVDSFSLTNIPKYDANFTHFAYVNPKAPKGGKITLPAYGSFDSFNPFIFKGIAFSEGADLSLESLGFSPLDDQTSVYPLLAEKFEFSEDNSFVGFFLNKNAKFSDGSPVTSDDVIFSFNSLIQKGSPIYKIYYSDVDRVEKINSHHVRFHYKKGAKNRELPLILSQFKVFSAKHFKDKDFATPTLEPMLGSGAYQITSFEPNKFVELTRNKNYWGKNLPSRKGYYNFDTIRYDFYQDTTVTLQALFSGSIDAREEYIAKSWVSGYDNKLVKEGNIIKEEIYHNNPATLQFFGFNTRLPKFSDRRVREAIGLAFNFEWANEKLFYNQYNRIYSLFSNTDMAAKGLPKGKEKAILSKYKKDLPPNIFTKEYSLPDNSTSEKQRENLKKAVELLNQAGYDFVDGKMTNLKTGKPLEIEVLSNAANGSSFTRVMLPFIENLRKIGIKMTFRNLEVNIFKNRLDNFEYEMAILSFRLSNLPGNEQRELWGSQSADMVGSYNVMGIKNKIVDSLITNLIEAQDNNNYKAYVSALDRVMMNEHYFIPQWYSPFDRIAYHKRLQHPKTNIKTGADIHTWWIKE
ncbi:MAG: ABC transporter substrate-binding protein [Alphaproteobacteria bacterium]|nr:ABC transporter substrate-binding protein [Alphaproteobacteria bacterium]